MPRTKKYNENEVIEKAMNLFWKNGYGATSMQMLEKEMGINKFSIYASFGNKNGVFLKSLKCYKQKLNQLINELKASNNGVLGIKQFFYNFIDFTKETEFSKGCLITNTANEIGNKANKEIKLVLSRFTEEVRQSFLENLKQNSKKSNVILEQQADYLIIAMFGLSSATKVFDDKQLHNFIENTFYNI